MRPISFPPSVLLRKASFAALTTTETDVVIIRDNEQPLRKSQLSMYLEVSSLGTHTGIKFRYYVSLIKDPAGTEGSASGANADWYLIPIKDVTTGALADIPSLIAATTKMVEDLGFSTCWAFKVTAQGVAGAGGAGSVAVCARDN